MSNSATINIGLKIDGKGSVRVLQNVGKESTTTGKKGKKAFNDMDRSAKGFTDSAKMSANTLLKMGAGVVGIIGLAKAWGSLKSAAQEYLELASVQESAERKLGAVLKATGEAAGFNLEQLKAMASGLQDVTRFGDETTLAGMAILATFKRIGGEAFERATVAAMDMSVVMETDLKSSILQIGKALNDPAKGFTALTRAGVTFTDSQGDTIKALQESGDMIGAQNFILKELESQFGGTAKAAADDFAGGVIQAKNALFDNKEEMGFVITKNQFFIDVVHMAKEEFKRWGAEIKNNRNHLMDLAKAGAISVVNSFKFMVAGAKLFDNSIAGIRIGFASMIELAAKAQIKYNEMMIPKRYEASGKPDPYIEKFKNGLAEAKINLAAAKAMMDGNSQVILDNEKAYGKLNAQIEQWTRNMKEIPSGLAGADYDFDYGKWDDGLNKTNNAVPPPGPARTDKELNALQEDIWGTSYDVDYGINELQAAIDKMLTARNNEALALKKNIDLQNIMALAIDDTYDIDYGNASDRFEELKKIGVETADTWSDAFSGWASGFAFDLTEMAFGADRSFNKIFESFGKMLFQMELQKQMSKALDWVDTLDWGKIGSSVTSFFTANAHGNVYAGPGISAYENQVISAPTIFPFAKGAGLMGEAGAEVIAPLFRASNGDMGVKMVDDRSGGGTTVINNNNTFNLERGENPDDDKAAARLIADTIDYRVRSIIRDEQRTGGMLNHSISRSVV